MNKLSVALITKNEERNVGRCLESLKWADEIVVLDGYSTDETVNICKKYTDKVYQKEFESFPKERDFVLSKTSNNWVLSVDSDMYFPAEVCEEIRQVLDSDPKVNGFLMRGLTIFLGQEIRHCSWFDLRYLRLFRKDKGRYDFNYEVLDLFYIEGKPGHLKNHFIHYGGDSFIDYFGRMRRTSYLTALEYKKKGLKITRLNWILYLFLKPIFMFFYKYIIRRGFLDGVVGFIVCVDSAINYFVAYAALWDIQRKEKPPKEF